MNDLPQIIEWLRFFLFADALTHKLLKLGFQKSNYS
jgi:hypothetical protein